LHWKIIDNSKKFIIFADCNFLSYQNDEEDFFCIVDVAVFLGVVYVANCQAVYQRPRRNFYGID
jgi:hypothetical protein